jgi:hypothetical protein
MAGAQTLLATAAIALFMLNLNNVNRSYLNSANENIDHQRDIDAINYGLSIIEELNAATYDYDNLYSTYSSYSNVNMPSKRLDHVSNIGDSLSTTISLRMKRF